MSKFVYKPEVLNQQVIPSLNRTIDKLNVIINKSSNVYIPYSFYYRDTLKGVLSSFYDFRNRLTKEVDLINRSGKLINDNLQEIEKELFSINNIEGIVKTDGYVK